MDQQTPVPLNQSTPRSWVVLVLLSFFLGFLGIDRFYMGKYGTGILKLLTGGGFMVWAFIDFVIILFNGMKDAEGRYPVR